MTEQQKLYACRNCNKVGMQQLCDCGSIPPRLHLENEEKPSIGNDDVFDRIDRELTELRQQENHSHINQLYIQKRLGLLEDKIKFIEEDTNNTKKIVAELLIRYKELIYKEKIQFERESAEAFSKRCSNKCEHKNTEDRLIFDKEKNNLSGIKEIYTICLDCKEKI